MEHDYLAKNIQFALKIEINTYKLYKIQQKIIQFAMKTEMNTYKSYKMCLF